MRKTFLQNEKKDAQRKKYLVVGVGILLIGIMLFSSVGYFFNYGANGGVGSFKEYGQTFTSVSNDQGTVYRTKLGGVSRDFYMLPTQVAYVSVDAQTQQVLTMIPQLKTVVLAVRPDGDFAKTAFGAASLILGDLYDQKKQILPAITVANSSITSIPVISCDNQSFFDAQNLSGQIPIIQVEESNQTRIYAKGNCVFVQGEDGQGIISAVERLRYGMWGIDFTKDATSSQ